MKQIVWYQSIDADGGLFWEPACPVAGHTLNLEPEGYWCLRCREHHEETKSPAASELVR